MMDAKDTIYKEHSNGKINYFIWSQDEQKKYFLKPEEVNKLLNQGAAELISI